jgi:hypothetical protein
MDTSRMHAKQNADKDTGGKRHEGHQHAGRNPATGSRIRNALQTLQPQAR